MLNSIVLNIHCEGELLLPTLRSLVRAVTFADNHPFELVAVFDRSDKFTRSVIDDCDLSVFESVKILEVDFGSLGLSRNAGIENARGDFIFLADADDIVSYNYFWKIITDRDKGRSKKTIYFPELYVEFDGNDSVYQHYGKPYFSPLMFFKWHPFGSRTTAYRKAFLHVPFAHIPVGNGYAYEDWHHNTALLAAGYRFHVTDDVILFYRRSKKSLSKMMATISVNIPPASSYFRPDIYVNLCREDYLKYRSFRQPEIPDNEAARQRAHELRPLFYDAHRIEPAINQDGKIKGKSGNNLNNFKLGAALTYYELCSIIRDMTFDHIVLMPFIAKGGAEKYVFNILDEICRQNPLCRILVLTGQHYSSQTWDEKLPVNATHIDLSIFSGYGEAQTHYLLILRLIEATATPECNIHITPSPYCHAFINSYRPVLKQWRFIFYHFCEHTRVVRGKFKRKKSPDFIEKNKDLCSLIISDNITVSNAGNKKQTRLPLEKFKCIYTLTEVKKDVLFSSVNPNPRVFWASRIDKEKRPELVPLTGERIIRSRPDKLLQVYGYSAFDHHLTERIRNADSIEYRGNFNCIFSIPVELLDILIYTSYTDGLPNVILEAIAMGMAVIAPDIGGIGEIIRHNETGILLPSMDSDEDMAQAYATATLELLDNPGERLRLVRNAQSLLKQQHSSVRFSQSVAQAFPPAGNTGEKRCTV